MTVKELFDFIKGVRPGFAFTDAQLTVWLNEIEGHVQTDIWLLEPAVDETQTGLVEYDSTIDPDTGEMVDANHELLVPFPWNKLYRYFLLMSIDLANGEYQRYANSYELFNEAYEEYAGWYAQHVSPANGEAITRGYYISAYQFAARGGYAGTEEEFYETLGGIGTIALDAGASALIAEGNALGTQNGVDVPPTSGYFHNNAAYYAGVAQEESAKLVDYNDMAYRANNAYAKKNVGGSDTVYFTDGAEDMPVDEMVIGITPTISSDAIPIPTAPITISGAVSETIYVKDAEETVKDTYLIPFEKNGTTYTVYYGSLNVVTGVLTLTHLLRTFTGDETWARSVSYKYFATQRVPGAIDHNDKAILSTGVCSHYKLLTNITEQEFFATDKTIVYALGNRGDGICIRDTTYENDTLYPTSGDKVAAFKAFLKREYNASHPVQLVYRLKTETTVNLTPTEVKTLLGTNVITADTGKIIALKYSVSPTIQNTIIEDSATKMRASGSASVVIDDAIGNMKIFDLRVDFEPTLSEESVTGKQSFEITRTDANAHNALSYTVQIHDDQNNAVYAGYYDGKTGYVEITHKKIVYTGSESWNRSTLQGKYIYYITAPSDCVPASVNSEDSTGWTNTYYHFVYNTNSSGFLSYDKSVAYRMQSVVTDSVFVYIAECNSVDDFKTILSEHNLHLVYRLATPVRVYVGELLDNITTLDGGNIFTNDAASFSFSYFATPGIKTVTPQMYGAIGDGYADDTEAFQKALNSGRDVFVPTAKNEIYRITDTLFIRKSGQRVFGDAPPRGGGLSSGGHIRFDFTGKSGTSDEKRGMALFKTNHIQMFHVCNLKFSTEPSKYRYGTLIDASSSISDDADKDIRIDNCFISNYHKVVNFWGRGFEMTNSMINGTYIGTFNWDDGEFDTVTGLGWKGGSESNSANMPFYGQRGIVFTGNRIHAMSGGIEIASGHAFGLALRGNTMDMGHGYIVSAADEAWSWIIEGNVFNALYKHTDQVAPIYFASGAKHCNITGNVISSPDDMWSVTRIVNGEKYWTVRDYQPSVDTFVECVGSYLYGVIASNMIYNCEYSCLTFDTITGSVISGNVFHNPGNKLVNPSDPEDEGNPEAAAIRLNGVSDRASITGNTVMFTETRNGVNPNVTFILATEGTELNNSAVFANAHGVLDSGMTEIISNSNNLKTDESGGA